MKRALYHWFSQHQSPLLKTPWQHADYLVLDLELNQLDPQHAELLSLATVEINQQRILVQRAYYQVNNTDTELNQSPVIHGLTPTDLETGIELRQILTDIQKKLQNAILICHHSRLDTQVLQRLFNQQELEWPRPIVIDTLALQRYILLKQVNLVPAGALQLAACRQHFDLPEHSQHNALSDALATAELFLAQGYYLSAGHPMNVKQLVQCSNAGR